MSIYDSNEYAEKVQPKIAAAYVRVSTGRQESEETIESQLDEIERKVIEDGNVLLNENIFQDDGWTGELLARPGLDSMRDAASAGRFQILYVYDRGRVAREYAWQVVVIDELEGLDISFFSLHDANGVSAEEKVMQAMQGVFAQYEKVKIAERMRRGKLYKVKLGVMINGQALYGFNYINKTDNQPGRYEVNDDQSRVVQMIFEWFGKEGVSIREIIKRLYELKIPPKKGRSDRWTKGPVVRLLSNESYHTGIIYYNKTESCVAKKPTKNIRYRKIKKNSRKVRPREDWIAYKDKVPVVIKDTRLFERVQDQLKLNKRFAGKKRKYNYLLTGRIFCDCGNPRVGDGSNKHGHFYYRCSERIKKFPGDCLCRSKGVNAELLDDTLWQNLIECIRRPEFITEAAKDFIENRSGLSERIEGEKKKLLASIAKVDEEQQRYVKAYGNKLIEDEQLRESMAECRRRRRPLYKQLERLNVKGKTAAPSFVGLKELCQETINVIKSLQVSDRARVIKELVEKIIIEPNRKVVVWGYIPLQTRELGYEPINWDCRSTECRKIDAV